MISFVNAVLQFIQEEQAQHDTHVASDDAPAWRVIDSRTGSFATKTTYKTRTTASRAADRLDNVYGAVRYVVKAI